MSATAEVKPGSGQMFDRIARRYDRLNRVISFGMDRSWRRKLVASLGDDPRTVLDVATGTADVALAVARTFIRATVHGVDTSEGMLEVGKTKVHAAGLDQRVKLQCADALALPFEDNMFDGACIAFGIRNLPDRLAGLREMTRVTRERGRVAVLELGEPRKGPVAPLARLHVHHVVPMVGAWLGGEPEYRYLERSIASFPPSEIFAGMMTEAGLTNVTVQPFAFGAAHLYVGTV